MLEKCFSIRVSMRRNRLVLTCSMMANRGRVFLMYLSELTTSRPSSLPAFLNFNCSNALAKRIGVTAFL